MSACALDTAELMVIKRHSPGAIAILLRRTRMLVSVESRVLLLMALLALGTLLFLHLASEVSEGDTMAFDRALLLSLRASGQPIGPHWLLKAMMEITVLGGGTLLTLMTCLVAAYLFAAKRAGTGLFVIAAVSGGAIFGAVLKDIFERPRPELVTHLVSVSSASFPSGHAMNSTVTYLTLGTLLAKTERSPRVRIYLISTAVTLSLIIGISRVYLGVHWPTDVIAGWCVGSVWALACSFAAGALQRRRSLTPAPHAPT